MKMRLDWIDYLKGICMFCVVMSHLYWPEWYERFLAPFYLAGFFFVSGYTFKLKSSFKEFLFVKSRTFLWPILALGFINAFIVYLYPGVDIKERLLGIMVQIPGLWDDLWFVACLFTMELIFYPFLRYVHSDRGRCVIISILVCGGLVYANSGLMHLPWHLENACIMLPFLYFGYWVKESVHGAKYFNRLRNGKVLLLLLVIYILLNVVYNNTPVDIHVLEYGFFPFYMLSAFIGVLLVASASLTLDSTLDVRLIKTVLRYVGKNSLVYYAFQSKIITAIIILITPLGWHVHSYVGNIISAVVVCMLLIVPTEIINRFFPFLLGRKRTIK